MLVQLLEKCVSESQSPQPKFVLVLNLTKSQQPSLEFTELNMFKHLVHLSVTVLRASDSQLKDYLVTSISQLTKDKETVTAELQRQLDSLGQQLESSLEQLNIKTSELDRVKQDLSSQASNIEKRLTKVNILVFDFLIPESRESCFLGFRGREGQMWPTNTRSSMEK